VSSLRRHRRPLAGIIAITLIAAACAGAAATPRRAGPSLDIVTITPYPRDSAGSILPGALPTVPSWFSVPMTDVNTGKQFTIGDFTGKVVLVETMATWCPTCQGEMSQVQDLITTLGTGADLVVVSLDVDPNEDAALLKKYTAKNGFSWLVAIAPQEVVRFLVNQYDQAFLNPPLQPMLFIDRQGGVWGLPTGVKSAISLQKTLEPYLAK
jgi:cytochrome oxidase Cu insertion factor (SCO1/SenC/PrrC family)